MPDQREVEVSEEAVRPAAKVIARALRHRAEQIADGSMGSVQTQTPNQVAEEALQAAAPVLCAQERERLLGEAPDEATAAADKAMRDLRLSFPMDEPPTSREQAEAALKAGAPSIRAAERERLELNALCEWLQMVAEGRVGATDILLEAEGWLLSLVGEAPDDKHLDSIRQQAAQQERERVKEAVQPALDVARSLAERVNQDLDDYPAYSSAEDAIQEAEAALTTLDKETD